MTHFWVRAESRSDEARVGLTPKGAAQLIATGHQVSVEDCPQRVFPIAAYRESGCVIVPQGAWVDAPKDAFILGLKELPQDSTPLHHRHIMFGHAYKGQASAPSLLNRFKDGGGTLFDLEYLTDADGKRVAAFGYWAGFAGAAVALQCWIAQQESAACEPMKRWASATELAANLRSRLQGLKKPNVLIIGALGRVGTGAHQMGRDLGLETTLWDIAETAHGGPFPKVLQHDMFLNCILAQPGGPVFVPASVLTTPRALRVIADIACDPESDYSPIKVNRRITTWKNPALQVHQDPVLDVTAIDNLPAMLPRESSEDFENQVLPYLMDIEGEVWQRARKAFETASSATSLDVS